MGLAFTKGQHEAKYKQLYEQISVFIKNYHSLVNTLKCPLQPWVHGNYKEKMTQLHTKSSSWSWQRRDMRIRNYWTWTAMLVINWNACKANMKWVLEQMRISLVWLILSLWRIMVILPHRKRLLHKQHKLIALHLHLLLK